MAHLETDHSPPSSSDHSSDFSGSVSSDGDGDSNGDHRVSSSGSFIFFFSLFTMLKFYCYCCNYSLNSLFLEWIMVSMKLLYVVLIFLGFWCSIILTKFLSETEMFLWHKRVNRFGLLVEIAYIYILTIWVSAKGIPTPPSGIQLIILLKISIKVHQANSLIHLLQRNYFLIKDSCPYQNHSDVCWLRIPWNGLHCKIF